MLMNSPYKAVKGNIVIFIYDSFVVKSVTKVGLYPKFNSVTDEKAPNQKYGLR